MVFQTLYPEELTTGKQLCYGECKADHVQQAGIEFLMKFPFRGALLLSF